MIFVFSGAYKCGRCEPLQPNNELFEEIAQHLEFPCIHEKCKEMQKWGTVQQHEEQCEYTEVKCPVGRCWEFTEVKNIADHFKTHDLKFEKMITSEYIGPKTTQLPYGKWFCITFKTYVFIVFAEVNMIMKGKYIKKHYCITFL